VLRCASRLWTTGQFEMNRKRLIVWVVLAVLATLAFVVLDRYCPPSGLALSADLRQLYRLKNRSSLPQTGDFDSSITLSNMLQPGADDRRWLETKAARIEGYVVSVGRAGIELANCWSPCRRDIHINLALRPDAPSTEQVIVEITPNFGRRAAGYGWDWSEEKVKQTLVGHWCRFEGWMFFDAQHAEESTNTHKPGADVWRATAWELHPVTDFEVVR